MSKLMNELTKSHDAIIKHKTLQYFIAEKIRLSTETRVICDESSNNYKHKTDIL